MATVPDIDVRNYLKPSAARLSTPEHGVRFTGTLAGSASPRPAAFMRQDRPLMGPALTGSKHRGAAAGVTSVYVRLWPTIAGPERPSECPLWDTYLLEIRGSPRGRSC